MKMDKQALPSKNSLEIDCENTEASSAASLLHYEDQPERYRTQKTTLFSIGLPWLLHLIFFVVSLTLCVTGILSRTREFDGCPGNWFPLLGNYPPIDTVRFDGTFNRSSLFKGPPSPAVDGAWASILPVKVMSIPESVFETLNASPYAVKIPPEAGGGRLGLFEAIHQVHCVKSLWMATYPDYYVEEYRYSQEHSEGWRRHIDHCADILRQKLMCEADATLITYNWIRNHYAPHPNFNVEHKCRNYSRLLEEAAVRGVKESLFPEGSFRRPSDGPGMDFAEPPFDPKADS